MTGKVYTWTPDMERLDEAVVAIGVFDGVHRGHQSLLRAAAADARRRSVTSVAVTFDRDPDQVVTPESAAPQLLTLEDKCRFIHRCGIRVVLVVPFDEEIAATPAELFLDEVLGSVLDVRCVHVGRDFHFGKGAAGDLDTLYVWGVENNAEIIAHPLVEHDGTPVTSTRIRALISSGEVQAAAELLGRPPRASGTVVEGRRLGAELGFPTANVEPVTFAALPADGVYAGYTVLEDGALWPSAISVGTPPSFPDVRDYLESHLIGFEGDLYGTRVVLEFATRMRGLEAFDSPEKLSAAIAADVAAVPDALDSVAITTPPEAIAFGGTSPGGLLSVAPIDLPSSDEDLVEDPEALAAAERAAAQYDPDDAYTLADDSWVEVIGQTQLSGFWATAGFTASLVTMPLQAADIPFIWDPYPPEQMPSFRPAYGAFDRGFSLLVPEERLNEARRAVKPVLSDFEHEHARTRERTRPDAVSIPVPQPAEPFDFDQQTKSRQRITTVWALLIGFLLLDIGLLTFWLLGWFE